MLTSIQIYLYETDAILPIEHSSWFTPERNIQIPTNASLCHWFQLYSRKSCYRICRKITLYLQFVLHTIFLWDNDLCDSCCGHSVSICLGLLYERGFNFVQVHLCWNMKSHMVIRIAQDALLTGVADGDAHHIKCISSYPEPVVFQWQSSVSGA